MLASWAVTGSPSRLAHPLTGLRLGQLHQKPRASPDPAGSVRLASIGQGHPPALRPHHPGRSKLVVEEGQEHCQPLAILWRQDVAAREIVGLPAASVMAPGTGQRAAQTAQNESVYAKHVSGWIHATPIFSS